MKNILLILILLISICMASNINNSRSFQFIYEVEIESTEGGKMELWIPIPQSNEVQEISNLNLNTNGMNYTIKDENFHGNKYLYINNESGTHTSNKITMTVNVIRKEHKNVKYNNVDSNKYLGAYTAVPIGGIFDYIISNNNLSADNVRGIFDYVLNGMHYGKPISFDDKYYSDPWLYAEGTYGLKQVKREKVVELYHQAISDGGNYTFGHGNAIYACDIGVGNCTDYHSYFMSLGRSMGIPVRFHMGFSIPSTKEGSVSGYHCWATYYVDNEGWYPVDISEAEKNPEQEDYYFGTLDNNRVAMIMGRDFILEGYEPETTNLFIYPIVEINDKRSSAFNKKFSFKNN